jgi:hypothetical protein
MEFDYSLLPHFRRSILESQNNCIELACQNKTDEIEEALTLLQTSTNFY